MIEYSLPLETYSDICVPVNGVIHCCVIDRITVILVTTVSFVSNNFSGILVE